MDHNEVKFTQDSSTEESENVLQERQKNGNENKSETGHERERLFFDVATSASEKESANLPE